MTVYVVIRQESFPETCAIREKVVAVCLNKSATEKYMKQEPYVVYYTIERIVDETNS